MRKRRGMRKRLGKRKRLGMRKRRGMTQHNKDKVPIHIGEGEAVQCAYEGEGRHPELVVGVHQEVGEVGAKQHDPVRRVHVALHGQRAARLRSQITDTVFCLLQYCKKTC